MVDAYSTVVVPFASQVASIVQSLSFLVGGVFGIYLITVYMRYRQYQMMKRLLTGIRKDIRTIGEHEGIVFEPMKESTVTRSYLAIKSHFLKRHMPGSFGGHNIRSGQDISKKIKRRK